MKSLNKPFTLQEYMTDEDRTGVLTLCWRYKKNGIYNGGMSCEMPVKDAKRAYKILSSLLEKLNENAE